MQRTDFRERTDKLREKGTYFLHPGEELGKKLKELIPLYEKAEFDKLDPDAPDYGNKHKALIQRYYGLQIKALQMMGYMQSEDELNLGAVKINMGMPYFDTKNIDATFATFIAQIKEKTRGQSAESAAYKNHVTLRAVPGDTPGNLRARFVQDIKNAAETQGAQYPNLRFVGGFNDFLLRILMQETLEKNEFIGAQEDKKGKSSKNTPLTAEEYLSGKLRRSGQSAIVRLSEIDRIAERLQNMSHTLDVSSLLNPWDNEIINLIGSTEQNRNLIRLTLFTETYEYENGKWYSPNGGRLMSKDALQDYPALQNLKNLRSFGDFQLREIKSLKYGFGNEFVTRDQLKKACAQMKNPSILSIVQDLQKNDIGIFFEKLPV